VNVTNTTFPPLNVTTHWADLNQHLMELVDAMPDDKLDWTPAETEWSARTIFQHIVLARLHWMANAVKDGEGMPQSEFVLATETKEGLKTTLRESWNRLSRFLGSDELLLRTYEPPPGDPETYLDPPAFDGHWIAFHRLVHDVHHRATILHYLNLLGVELPAERRRRPL
jgi:uncharacterized damage-inducible protein DinB